jgi:hypothetical protein
VRMAANELNLRSGPSWPAGKIRVKACHSGPLLGLPVQFMAKIPDVAGPAGLISKRFNVIKILRSLRYAPSPNSTGFSEGLTFS